MSHFAKTFRRGAYDLSCRLDVTGTDGGGTSAPRNMTGTFFATGMPPGTTVLFGSGAFVPGDPRAYPSGSFAIVLPTPYRLTATDIFRVELSHASATDVRSNALGLNSTLQYRALPYGHTTVSGTYVAGFVRFSGSITGITDSYNVSGTWVGDVPMDRVNPSSMMGPVYIEIKGRKA